MAVKIDTLEKVPPHVAIAAGLGGKANLLINGEFRAETTRCSKCDQDEDQGEKWHGKFPGRPAAVCFHIAAGLRHEVFRVRFGASSTIAILATTIIPNALLKPNSCAVNPISGGPVCVLLS
jgi:hypothetical protein